MMNLKDKFTALPKESRTNIIVMIILGLMFVVGIIIRWDYISGEVSSTVDHYVDMFDADSIKNREVVQK